MDSGFQARALCQHYIHYSVISEDKMMLLCLAVLSLGLVSGQPPRPEECCTAPQYEGHADGGTAVVRGTEVPKIYWVGGYLLIF